MNALIAGLLSVVLMAPWADSPATGSALNIAAPIADTTAADTAAADTTAADTTAADTTAADTTAADTAAGTNGGDPAAGSGGASSESSAPEGWWPEAEQEPVAQQAGGFDFPARVSGSARMVTDAYLSHGIDPRRPGARWRMVLSPRATLFGEVSVSAELLVSTEETEFRQNIGQIGLNPSWRWVTLHVGDFTNDYTKYTVQGSRVRGGGVDLEPGDVRFSVQGGRVLRSASPAGGTTYARDMVAARLGYGDQGGSHLRLTVVGGRDSFDQAEQGLPDPDTLLLDTVPEDLRPEMAQTPQEGMTASMDGQLVVLDRLVTLKGEIAASVINRDRRSDVVELGSLDLGVPGFVADALTSIQEPRTSAAADYAWNLEAGVREGGARLRGRYEYVGPGFGSLGLPYLVGDRKGYEVDGGLQLLDGVLGLQGRYQHRTNNLASQRLNTVDRQTVSSSVSVRASEAWTAVFTGVLTDMTNDAASDSVRLDNRSTTFVTNLVHQRELFGKTSTITLGYNLQRTTDGRAGAAVPEVTTHQLQTSVQVPITENVSGAPSVSGVFTTGDGVDDRTDIYLGFNGQGRFLDGDLRTTAGASTSVSRGRRIFNANVRAMYPIGWGADVVARFRQAEYSAFGDRPAFGESFFTLSVNRSF